MQKGIAPTVRNSREYAEELVKKNLGLARNIARSYQKSARAYSESDYEDLYSFALFGLYKAARKFDESLGCTLSTYAYPWMQREIMTGICGQRGVKFRQLEYFLRIKKYQSQHIADGEELSLEEIAKKVSVPLHRAKVAMLAMGKTLSLSTVPKKDDEDSVSVGRILSTDPRTWTESEVEKQFAWDILLYSRAINKRERKILYLLYMKGYTLQKASEVVGVCRERVRQLKERAIQKLRNHYTGETS